MDTSINDRLNTMNQSVEAKKKIDNAIQRIEEVYEKNTEISNRFRAAEDRLNNFNKTWAEFGNHLDGMSNVFDGMKEKEKEIKEKPLHGALRKN